MNIYEAVTERILKKMEQGVIPWRKTWATGLPKSLTTGKEYRGMNIVLLGLAGFDSRYWVTFRETQRLGGYVRKGLTPTNDPRTSVGTPHPVVIEHPVSGELALYLGRRRNAYVMGHELAESERLLDEIWSFVETALYRHRWALGDLVLWDNRTTMHRRDAFDPKARRVMHRTQIKGSGAPRRATRSGITG